MVTERRGSDTPLDVAAIRADFPILDSVNERGQRIAFLDSAASSQKPEAVIAALGDYYRTTNANIHRGVYALSEQATARYEEARHLVADFVNAASAREIVFVRNATEAINLVARTWGRRNVREGDLIVVTLMDHHSNLVPWQLLAEEVGAEIAGVRLTPEGLLDLDHLDELLARGPKLVAFPHVSNTLGTINPAAEIVRRAHAAGAVTMMDGAQSVPHLATDVQAIACDFLAFSGHKMLAPMGSGGLYGKRALLEKMPPFMGGGGMIRKVEIGRSTWADVPARFEAGTPAVGEAVGLGAAVEYLQRLGMDRVRAHERELTIYALERFDTLRGVTAFGPRDPDRRAGVISFDVEGIHPHDVAAVLDGENVAVRAGHHCCQPLMRELDVVATTRASFYVYNDETEVDRLIAGIEKAQRLFDV
ncbi:MAG: SufS family cysteine desulfurase [Hyphomicrobiales bacterium]|nr:SufS family cysteine desulfurase [Hyphomicrobiales bacterium]